MGQRYYEYVVEVQVIADESATTIGVTAAQLSAYFNAGDEAEKKIFLEKINVCIGVVGESILYTQAKKACTCSMQYYKGTHDSFTASIDVARMCTYSARHC